MFRVAKGLPVFAFAVASLSLTACGGITTSAKPPSDETSTIPDAPTTLVPRPTGSNATDVPQPTDDPGVPGDPAATFTGSPDSAYCQSATDFQNGSLFADDFNADNAAQSQKAYKAALATLKKMKAQAPKVIAADVAGVVKHYEEVIAVLEAHGWKYSAVQDDADPTAAETLIGSGAQQTNQERVDRYAAEVCHAGEG